MWEGVQESMLIIPYGFAIWVMWCPMPGRLWEGRQKEQGMRMPDTYGGTEGGMCMTRQRTFDCGQPV